MKKITFFAVIISAVLLAGCQQNQAGQPLPDQTQQTQTATASLTILPAVAATQENTQQPAPVIQPVSSTMAISIMAPEDEQGYITKMNEFYQEQNGVDPSKTWPFMKKELQVPFSSDPIMASAQAAAGEIPPRGGPAKATVAYLKIQNNTAYAELDIDLDGWAGVSYSIAVIHPLVEKTLLQFSGINNVVFGYAPGDGKNNPGPVLLTTIENSGSTNAQPYTVKIFEDGSAAVTGPGRTEQDSGAGTVDAAGLKTLLQTIGDVSQLTGHCGKSVSFGTTTEITYNGKTSGDISCISTGSGHDLYLSVAQIESQLKIGMINRHTLAPM
jgi:outer membrane murein-binding lipoprotein Lpp